MRGKIIRGIGGFYYVHAENGAVYECRARGIFRKEKVQPLVGDNVRLTVLDEKEKSGNVDALFPRRNMLMRPSAANVDQAMLVFAMKNPDPNLGLLDRFLILMEQQQIPVCICFNKTDLADEGQERALREIYAGCGCRINFVSVERGRGLSELRELLEGKTTVLAGPSGVGKSSLTNAFFPEKVMETGELSKKLGRGKNTTRHTELLILPPEMPSGSAASTYLLDTPGFASLYLQEIGYEELKEYYPEFTPYVQNCRFAGCNHLKEPDCAVKKAVKDGNIHPKRYEGYVLLAEELRERKRYENGTKKHSGTVHSVG